MGGILWVDGLSEDTGTGESRGRVWVCQHKGYIKKSYVNPLVLKLTKKYDAHKKGIWTEVLCMSDQCCSPKHGLLNKMFSARSRVPPEELLVRKDLEASQVTQAIAPALSCPP